MKRILILLVFIAAIVVCYYYVDRRVVGVLHEHDSQRYLFLKVFANYIVAVLVALIFATYIYGIAGFLLKQELRISKGIFAICNSVVIAIFLKDAFKYIFARTWPATFVCNNPSLITNHVYGFNWFHSGTAYSAFPSGHSAFIFAFAASLWCAYPKWRWLAILLPLLVICGQIGMYYHFVSDTIAGAGLGILVAYFYVNQNKLVRE
jgi:membrane-associated phospholipid phosphatase